MVLAQYWAQAAADAGWTYKDLISGTTPSAQQAAFNSANDVYAGMSAKNAAFKKVFDSQMAFRKEGVLWGRVAENTYDNFMARQSAANKL